MAILSMTKMVIQKLFSKPVTERYPFVPKVYPVGARGQVRIEVEKCIYCGICQRRCPTAALTVSKEQKTWEVDRLRCISCNLCVDVCPKKCLALDTKYSPCCTGAQKDSYHA